MSSLALPPFVRITIFDRMSPQMRTKLSDVGEVNFLGWLPLELNPRIYIIVLGIPTGGEILVVNIGDGNIRPIRLNFGANSKNF